jgi:hypothetical protein
MSFNVYVNYASGTDEGGGEWKFLTGGSLFIDSVKGERE